MPGLLDIDPEVLAMLSGTGSPFGGLLGSGPRPPGLLAGFQPRPDEGFLDKFLGTNDPRDPRGQAMGALAQGLLRGSFADGLAGANRAFVDVEDRSYKRQAQGLAMTKDVLSLNELVRKQREESQGRDVLRDYWKNRGVPGGGAMPGAQGGQGMKSGEMPSAMDPQAMGGDPSMGYGGPQAGGASLPGGASMQPGGMAPKADTYTQYRQLGDAFAAQGLGAKAQSYYEMAEKYRPKYSQTPQLMKDPRTGNLVQVLISDDGSTQVLPFGAKPDVSLENLGGRTMAIDKNNVRDRETFDRSMTPGEVASNRVAQGNLGVAQSNLSLARQRLALDENSPQYMNTDAGLVALPKRPQPGAQLIGQPVSGPDGQPLRAPLKAIPASANTAIVTNTQNLATAQRALALLQGGKVGSAKGDTAATGVKGYLPNGMLNRLDPAGVDTRAEIGDLGSMVIHDRSGAAVTAAESPRLMPFIPLVTDDKATAEKKLKRFISVYQQETDALAQSYSSDQGYKESPVLKRTAGGRDTLPGALPLPPKPTASTLKRGQTYQLPNGVEAEWDGLQFKTKGGR